MRDYETLKPEDRQVVDKAQEYVSRLKEEKGELWALIVHEVSMLKAIVNAAKKQGDDETVERLVSFGAIHTAALCKFGKLEDREKEIMEDVDGLLDLAVTGILRNRPELAGRGSNETVH